MNLLGIIGILVGLGMFIPMLMSPTGNQAVVAEWTAATGILILIFTFFGWIVLAIITVIFSSAFKRQENNSEKHSPVSDYSSNDS